MADHDPNRSLLADCNKYLSKDWTRRIEQVLRGKNYVAVTMASIGVRRREDLNFWDYPLEDARAGLNTEEAKTASPRAQVIATGCPLDLELV
ncbi:hypothetical protein Nepgr_017956 [Nepenthes gracilis]|uniref:Uncharacterized protein n=1 Tax=Nepenthes gracilis TaxID=150966 RepID=A0AAD3SQD8_NEPGR|nr:hypothetical protein Nepgr_017956 [Nepenthes gracilis]